MTEKLKKFLISDEFYELADKLDEILNIDPKQDFERDSKVVIFLDTYFREKLAGESLINYIKTNFDWLSEEELNKFLNFIQENLFQKREELWQEEVQEKEPEIAVEEPLEEKEKRYLELIKNIIQPMETKTSTPKTDLLEKQEEKKKTTIFEPKEIKPKEGPIIVKWQKKEEEAKPEVPEDTIIIRHKEEKKNNEENTGDVIDLSKI